MRAWLIAGALLAGQLAHATDASRYQLSGSGTLRPDPPLQTNATWRLNATLQSHDAALAASPTLQENSRFALMASVSAAPHVCYNDTIFRDDFDGDGF
jgi:hypothetical protein